MCKFTTYILLVYKLNSKNGGTTYILVVDKLSYTPKVKEIGRYI